MQNKQFITYHDPSCTINEAAFKKINLGVVGLRQGLWSTHKMKQICPLIKEWKTEEIFLKQNNNPLIAKQISSISFPYLKTLSLRENNIESIEGLSRIWMPELQSLGFSYNRICTIADVRKGYWYELFVIYLYGNLFQDFFFLSELHSTKIKELFVELETTDPQQSPNQSWLLKLEVKKLTNLQLKSGKRIKLANSNVKNCMTKKYSIKL